MEHKIGDLVVWNIINIPGPAIRVPVKSPIEAYELIDQMAELQIEDDTIESNVFGLEFWNGEEWEEWLDDDGWDISGLRHEDIRPGEMHE